MVEGLIEKGISGLVQAATGGRYLVEKNPVFEIEWKKIEAEDRNPVTRFYDLGTLFIINDINHTVVSRFVVRKKRRPREPGPEPRQ